MKYIYILFLVFSLNVFAKDKLNKENEPCARIDGFAVTVAFDKLKQLKQIKYEDWDKKNTTVEVLLSEKIEKINSHKELKKLRNIYESEIFYRQVYKINFHMKNKIKYFAITENIISSIECSITEPIIYLEI